MYRIDNIHLKPPVENEKDALNRYLVHTLKLPGYTSIVGLSILKRSLDARKKPELYYVYSVAFDFEDKRLGMELMSKSAKRNAGMKLYQPRKYSFPTPTLTALRDDMRPVVVGSGPAGLFCAWHLAMAGLRPVVIERGGSIEERTEAVGRFWESGELDGDTNVQFGEGGAGTFSDGKLYTQTDDKAGMHSEVLKLFVENGAPSDILYDSHPHIGTDVLKSVVVNMRTRMQIMGAEFFFHTKFLRPLSQDGKLKAIELNKKGVVSRRACDCLVLACGHSARDTYEELHYAGVELRPKPFAVGFRVMHEQEFIDHAQYGDGYEEKKLPPAEYRLTAALSSGRSIYSFCMCPGGYVVNASSAAGALAVNGMSDRIRDSGVANSAIVLTVDQDIYGDGLFDGMRFQEQLERAAYEAAGGAVPLQCLGDYISGEGFANTRGITPAVKGKFAYAPLNGILPEALESDMREGFTKLGRIIHGFDDPQAVLAAVESRTSAPFRIPRGDKGHSSMPGLFPCGEGAGYAGGITSAAVDGIRTAEKVCEYRMGRSL